MFPMYTQMGITYTVQQYNSTIKKAYLHFPPNFFLVNYIVVHPD